MFQNLDRRIKNENKRKRVDRETDSQTLKGFRNTYFHNQELLPIFSEPNFGAKNDGNGLKAQFWARRVPTGAPNERKSVFWAFFVYF